MTRLERRLCITTALAALLLCGPAVTAQVVTFHDVNPDMSDEHPNDPDGATGGRVNQLAIEAGDNQTIYAASEWGGIYKTADGGLNWNRLDGHLPVVTWDVEVDPINPSKVYATSFYDGRTTSTSGINVSTDSGATWSHPATSAPPAGFCAIAADQTELAAFGISIDPSNNSNVFIGTSCGMARSTDAGVTWTYRDPTGPAGSADRVWDVLSQGGGLLDVCGDDGHLRSTDGGTTWTAGSGLASGRCSLAASPDESYVLLAVVGTTIYETDNANSGAGATWSATRSNPSPQGRIPFVATNQRSDVGPNDVFDLWFGDVSLYRVSCTSATTPGGSPRCGTGSTPAWVGGFTRSAGGHDDMGDILFDPQLSVDACPLLMSSDGGVYYNTVTGAGCDSPFWNQPNITPHGLWAFTMSGADRSGGEGEDLYFGNQDNGVFGTVDAGALSPTWHNEICCDGFDTGADADGVLWDVCCFGGGRSTRVFRSGPGFVGGGGEITYPSSGTVRGFRFPDNWVNVGGRSYAMILSGASTGGVFYTPDIDAGSVTWTELGPATEPPNTTMCGIKVAFNGTVPTFFVQTGDCNTGTTTDRLFKYTGTSGLGSWTEIFLPLGGLGVFDVDPADPTRLIASGQIAASAAMYSSTDGGSSWSGLAALDSLMTGSGAFPIKNSRGPTNFTGFGGYWQPNLVAFGPPGSDLIVAGGKDSGIFLSTDDGASWGLVSDPYTSDISGTPHIPRPWYAYFDVEGADTRDVYIGTQGRGIWRMEISTAVIFTDGFESGDTSAWSASVPP